MESALPYFAVTRVLLAAAAALRGSFAGTAINAKVKKIAATQRLIAMRRIGSSENAAYYRESGREAYTELWYRASAQNLVSNRVGFARDACKASILGGDYSLRPTVSKDQSFHSWPANF